MRQCKSQTIKIDIRPLISFGKEPKHSRSNVQEGVAADHFDSVDFRFLFEHAYDAILMANLDGFILETNTRAVSFFGYNNDDFPRMDIRTLIPGLTDELFQQIKEDIFGGRFMRIQAFALHKGGEDYSAVEIIPLGNQADKISYICFLIRDIQSRYIAEENLHSTYLAMDNTDSGIGIVNMEGIITYANRKMIDLLGGGNTDAVVGRKLEKWFDLKTVVNPIITHALKGEVWFGEQSVVGHAHSSWLYISAVPNESRDGELTGAVLSIRDMANARRADIAEYQAERNRIMVESLAGVCHAIGQPATVLLTSLELMKINGFADLKKAEQMLDMSYEAVIQIRDLLYKMNAKQLYAAELYLSSNSKLSSSEFVPIETTPP
jgi:PAS domain S-box-containing protein